MIIRTQQIAEGRSFGTGTYYDGACKIIDDFMVANGWFVHLDSSSDGSYPCKYYCNKETPAVNDTDNVFIRIGYDLASSGNIRINYYLGINSVGSYTLPWLSGAYGVSSYDSAQFEIQIRTDVSQKFLAINTKLGSTYSSSILTTYDYTTSSKSYYGIEKVVSSVSAGSSSYEKILTLNSYTGVEIGQWLYIIDTENSKLEYVYVSDVDDGVSVTITCSRSLDGTYSATTTLAALPYRLWAVSKELGSGNLYMYMPYSNFRTAPFSPLGTSTVYNGTYQDFFLSEYELVQLNNARTMITGMISPNYSKYSGTTYYADGTIFGTVNNFYAGDDTGTELASGAVVNSVEYIKVCSTLDAYTDHKYFIEHGSE